MTAETRRQAQRVTARREADGTEAEYLAPARTARTPAWSGQPDIEPRQAALALFTICFVTLAGATAFVAIWMSDMGA